MAITRSVSALLASGVATAGAVAAMVSAVPAWAGGPDGHVEGTGTSRAVGSGVLNDAFVGYVASGATNQEATTAVIAQCHNAGADQCTSDEVTSEPLCVVSVGAADGTVSGGAGTTVEAARQNAFENATAVERDLGPDAKILASSCP